jgi:hypothetical protein
MSTTTISRPAEGTLRLGHLAAIVNECAALRAEIDDLTKTKERLEAELIASGLDTIEGALHVVTISYGLTRVTVDWKAVAAKFEPSHQLVTAHTKEGAPFNRVTYSARRLATPRSQS